MHLEQQLSALIAALEANTAAVAAAFADMGAKVVAKTAKVETPAPKAEAPAPKAEAPAPKAEAPAPDYDQVKAVVLKAIAAKGQPAVLGVLSTFGVAKATGLTPDQYAACIAACEAL